MVIFGKDRKMKQNKTILQIAIILTVILIGAGSVSAKPNKKGKDQKLSKQEIKNTFKQIKKHKPELAEKLLDIKKEDPKLFAEKISYMRKQWENKKQAEHKKQAGQKKKMMQYGKGPKAFGDKGKGPKQCDAEPKMRRQGRGKRGMMHGRGQKGRGQKMDDRRPNRQQRGKGKSQVCQRCGAGYKGEMMGRARRQRGMGRGMGNRGPRQSRDRQW